MRKNELNTALADKEAYQKNMATKQIEKCFLMENELTIIIKTVISYRNMT